MSVMIASPETTAKIADLIYRVVRFGYEQERFSLSRKAENHIRLIWGKIDAEREQRINEALRALNRNSYNTRYKEKDVSPFVDYPYEHKQFKQSEGFFKGENGAEDYQKLKSVQFFIYQCDEHDKSSEAVKMFSVLKEIQYFLTYNIIKNTPEWKSAKWG